MEKEEFLKVYRHSLSHILAKAVIEIFGKENVQYAIGPQIADGFYYDFVLPRAVTKDDYEAIENRMREILKRREAWTRKEVSRTEALDIFITHDQPNEAQIETFATIPAGQSAVEIPITTLNDGVQDGNKLVNITVNATGFSPGICYFQCANYPKGVGRLASE